jgi:hypothetical protein
MRRALATFSSDSDAAGIGDANHEASSVRWLGRWSQKSEKENCPIGMISVIATANMSPTKPPNTASIGDLLRKEHGPGPGKETLGPGKRSRAGTSETQLIAVFFRSVLPLDDW